MNSLKIAASVFTIALIALSTLSILASPAQAVTAQSVDISSAVSGQAQWITYDSANSRAWISVGVSVSNLYKVNLNTVLVQGAGAVTGYTSILGNACGGSLADGPASGVMLNGYLWVTAWYSNNCIGVSQIDSSGTVLNTFTYSGPTDARAIMTDGTDLIVGTSGKVLRMTQAGAFSVLASTSSSVTSLVLDGSTIWFTQGGSAGLGRVNADGTGLQQLSCSCLGGTFIALKGSDVWFTSNQDHTLIKYDGSAFTSYSSGMASDGPYGLTFDSTRNGFWLQGYANNKVRFFDLASLTIDSTKDVNTSKKPFQGFADSGKNVWNMALGSNELIRVAAPASTTTTTSTITSTGTSTSVSGTSTSTTTTTTTITSTFVTEVTITTSPGFGGLPSYVPQRIPVVTLNSTGIAGQRNIYATLNGSVTLTGFLWFQIGGSAGDFECLIANPTGVCITPTPSRGTFNSFGYKFPDSVEPQPACSIIPYLWFCKTTASPVNQMQTSQTYYGTFCNNAYIVKSAAECNGNGIPISYQTFSVTVSNLPLGVTVITLLATGTESNGEAFKVNVFIYNVGS